MMQFCRHHTSLFDSVYVYALQDSIPLRSVSYVVRLAICLAHAQTIQEDYIPKVGLCVLNLSDLWQRSQIWIVYDTFHESKILVLAPSEKYGLYIVIMLWSGIGYICDPPFEVAANLCLWKVTSCDPFMNRLMDIPDELFVLVKEVWGYNTISPLFPRLPRSKSVDELCRWSSLCWWDCLINERVDELHRWSPWCWWKKYCDATGQIHCFAQLPNVRWG